MCVLSSGTSTKAQEEYYKMGESIAREAILCRCRGVRHCFGGQCLHQPTHDDNVKQMEIKQGHRWPNMFGSID